MLFQHTRTRRLNVTLRELTLAEAINLCGLPAELLEATATEMLRYIASGADTPTPRYVRDPLLMTVQERTYLVAQYLAQVSEDGPDFSLGSLHYTDYVQFDRDIPGEETGLGVVAGKERVLRHLLGAHVQAMEVLCKKRGDWIVAAIACQMCEAGAQSPDWAAMSQHEVMQFLDGAMGRLRQMPESMFEEVYAAYWRGTEALYHFFSIEFDDAGIVCLPHKETEVGLVPARFRADSCIGTIARLIAGQPA